MSFQLVVVASLLATVHSGVIELRKIGEARDAKPGEFPHQASLQFGIPGVIPFTHYCGGSILNEYWILTAADCIDLIDKLNYLNGFVIKAGKLDISQIEDTEQVSQVGKYFKYEGHLGNDEKSGAKDIGLIKLKTPLHFNDWVEPIALPIKGDEPKGVTTLAGWGDIDNNTQTPILQTTDLLLMSRKDCIQAIEKIVPGASETFDESNICTEQLAGGRSPCSGDFGGPLIAKNKNGKSEVIGVVSWGLSLCEMNSPPVVYVKVSDFVDWIYDIMIHN